MISLGLYCKVASWLQHPRLPHSVRQNWTHTGFTCVRVSRGLFVDMVESIDPQGSNAQRTTWVSEFWTLVFQYQVDVLPKLGITVLCPIETEVLAKQTEGRVKLKNVHRSRINWKKKKKEKALGHNTSNVGIEMHAVLHCHMRHKVFWSNFSKWTVHFFLV